MAFDDERERGGGRAPTSATGRRAGAPPWPVRAPAARGRRPRRRVASATDDRRDRPRRPAAAPSPSRSRRAARGRPPARARTSAARRRAAIAACPIASEETQTAGLLRRCRSPVAASLDCGHGVRTPRPAPAPRQGPRRRALLRAARRRRHGRAPPASPAPTSAASSNAPSASRRTPTCSTRRLERAAALLRTTDRSVADICFSVGLHSVGSFTTSFARTYGLTPTAYRAAFPPASAPGAGPGLRRPLLRPPATPHVSRRQHPGPT